MREELPVAETDVKIVARVDRLRDTFDRLIGVGVSDENGRKILDRVEDVLRQRGYGNDVEMYELTVRILWCESRLDPLAKNRQAVVVGGISYGHASGLFQFLPSTFASVSNGDIWSVEDQTNAYVTMVEQGRIIEWACY